MSRLIQLKGEGDWEELYTFPDGTTDEQIQQLYRDFNKTEYDSFEEYLESLGEWAAVTERVFVDEIYV